MRYGSLSANLTSYQFLSWPASSRCRKEPLGRLSAGDDEDISILHFSDRDGLGVNYFGVCVRAFELPWPPSVNRYWRHAQGRTFISKDGKQYRQDVAKLLCGVFTAPTLARLKFEVVAYPPDKRKRDLDNVFKALLDACEGVVYEDDSQIDRLSIERGPPEKPGKVVCMVGGVSEDA